MKKDKWDSFSVVNGKVGEGVKFERIRRITGYLVGTVERIQQCETGRGAGQGEAYEHDARGCPGGMKRPRRGSDGEAMKYGMHGIPAQEFSMLIIRQRVKGKAV